MTIGQSKRTKKVKGSGKARHPKRDTSNWRPDVVASPLTEDEIDTIHSFGYITKNIRLGMSLSQNDFAKLVGTSRSQIDRFENHGNEPKLSTVIRFAKALKVPYWRLWSGGASELEGQRGPTEEQWQFLDLFEAQNDEDRDLLLGYMRFLLQRRAERLGIG